MSHCTDNKLEKRTLKGWKNILLVFEHSIILLRQGYTESAMQLTYM